MLYHDNSFSSPLKNKDRRKFRRSSFLSLVAILSYYQLFRIVSELECGIFIFVCHHQSVVFSQTGTGRNQVTADDVLLHTLKIIGLTVDCSLVKHLGGRICSDVAGTASRTCITRKSLRLRAEFSSRSLRTVII